MGPPSKRASRRRGGGQVHLPVPATSPPFPSGKIDRQVEQMECRGNTRRCFGWKDFAILLEWRFDPPFRSDPFRISRNFGERKEGRKTSRDSSLLHKCMARIGVIIRWKETRVESVSNFIGRIFRHDTFFFFFVEKGCVDPDRRWAAGWSAVIDTVLSPDDSAIRSHIRSKGPCILIPVPASAR